MTFPKMPWLENNGTQPVPDSEEVEVLLDGVMGPQIRVASSLRWDLYCGSFVTKWRKCHVEFETKDSGKRAEFDSGMQRDTNEGKARFELLLPIDVPYKEQFLTRCAELMGRGAVKYKARNWEQANSVEEMERFKESAIRHFQQWMSGEEDEDHASAVFFNLLGYETTKYKIERSKDFD